MTDSQGIIAYDDNLEIKAAAVFDSFTVDACDMHLAIDNPCVIRCGFFSSISNHLFVLCGRDRVFAPIASTNKKALRAAVHAGFREAAVISDGREKGVDLVVMRMDKADCRWLDKEVRAA